MLVTRTGTALSNSGEYPTASGWNHCLFEDAQEAGGTAVGFNNTSGIWLYNPVFQGNLTLHNLLVNHDADAETGCDFRMGGRVWMEDNGNGAANSTGVYLKGASGHLLTGATIEGLRPHGSSDHPRYLIWAEYTDGLRVSDCSGGLGGSSEFVHDGGNNSNFDIDWRGATDPCGLKSEVLWASIVFDGLAGVTVKSSKNLSAVRNGAGDYTLTFTNAPPAAYYNVTGSAEDNSGVGSLSFSPGITSSTASFDIAITDSAGTLTDGRTINVQVLAYPS
jgi:hypothetical protein